MRCRRPAVGLVLAAAACSHLNTASAGGPEFSRREGPAAGAPSWLVGEDPRFPRRQWLCAVGRGPAPGHADQDAWAALSRVFRAEVVAVSSDEARLRAAGGGAEEVVQTLAQRVDIASRADLEGVEIVAGWAPPDAEAAALACIRRAPACARLARRAAAADAQATAHLAAAADLGAAQGWAALCRVQAARTLAGRRDLALAQRAVLRAEGPWPAEPAIPLAPAADAGRLAAALAAATANLRVELRIDDPLAAPLRPHLSQTLAAAGLSPAPADDATSAVVVELAAAPAGQVEVGGRPVVLLRGSVHMRVVSLAGGGGGDGRTHLTACVQHKVGALSEPAASAQLVRELAPRAAAALAAALEDAWRRPIEGDASALCPGPWGDADVAVAAGLPTRG